MAEQHTILGGKVHVYKRPNSSLWQRAHEPKQERYKWESEQLHDYVLFSANTGLRPDEARRLQFRDVTIVEDEASGQTILEIEVRGKRGVGYCKSMSGAVRPFERLKARLGPPRANETRADARTDGKGPNDIKNGSEEWRLPQPTDLIFPKWKRELFKTILDEENLRFDREGRPRNRNQLSPELLILLHECKETIGLIDPLFWRSPHIQTHERAVIKILG